MRDLHAVHEDKEEIAEKERIAEIHARVAESQAQVKKWMEEFGEDSERVRKLGGH